MTRKGPERLRLESYLKNANPQGISEMVMSLNKYQIKVDEAAKKLQYAAGLVNGSLEGLTAAEAGPRFHKSSVSMTERSETVQPANSSLVVTSITVAQAIQDLAKMGDVPSDPPATDPTTRYTPEGEKAEAKRNTQVAQNQAAYEAQEKQAKIIADGMDTQFEDSIVEMKKIHGIPDPPPPPTPGSPQGPSGGGGDTQFSGATGPGNNVGPNGSNQAWVKEYGWVDNSTGDPYPPPRFPGPGGGGVYEGPGDGPGSGPGGTVIKDPGTPTPGGPGTTSTNDPYAGVSGEGVGSGSATASGGLSGSATAGIAGGVALGVGGLGMALGKGLAAKGVSMPTLTSGAAGKIGATARSAGSAVTGRGGTSGAGAKTGAGSGTRAGGRGGAGAGAAGKRGGAGGRGAGGRGAGGKGAGGAGRGGKKDKGKKGDIWDGVEDGDQWLDDDAAGGAVIE